MTDGDEMRKFITDFTKFQGRMEHFEETTNAWYKDTNIRLTNMESLMSELRSLRESLMQINQIQSQFNLGQENKNVKMAEWQGKQDNRLGGLEEQDKVSEEHSKFIEYKISNRDFGKILLGVAALIAAIVPIFTFIIEYWFHR